MSTIKHASAALQHAMHLRQRARRLRARGAAPAPTIATSSSASVDRQCFHVAAADYQPDADPSSRLPRRLHHVGRSVDGDHLRDVRRDELADLARAASQIADGQRGIDQRQQR
jgi:hypothetical protein